MNIEMALKSRSYINNLDCVKLSLRFFFWAVRWRVFFFTSLQDLPLFLSKKTHQKAENLTFRILLPMRMISVWFLWGQLKWIKSSDEKVFISKVLSCNIMQTEFQSDSLQSLNSIFFTQEHWVIHWHYAVMLLIDRKWSDPLSSCQTKVWMWVIWSMTDRLTFHHLP